MRRALQTSFDLFLVAFAALAWGFASFAFGSRWLSPTAGGLLGIGFVFAMLATLLTVLLNDQRSDALRNGACPRCDAPISSEHRHRRWDAAQGKWLPPSTAWDCLDCQFSHGETWACPACPR